MRPAFHRATHPPKGPMVHQVSGYPTTAERAHSGMGRRVLFSVLATSAALLVGILWVMSSVPSTIHAATPESGASKAIVHTWKRIFYGNLDGKPGLLFADRFDRAKPALGDLDGDGDLDLFLGRGDGRVMYFQNRGSKQKADWRLLNEAISAFGNSEDAQAGRASRIDVGANAAPTLTDMDGDGDLDLFIGSADGQVYHYVNTGNRFLPTFELATPNLLGVHTGLNVVVKFPDLNGDGLPDLSLGNEAGVFRIALNQGTRESPSYCFKKRPDPDCLAPVITMGSLSPEDNAVPEWVDWDRDGDLDLLVGKSDGTMAYWRNIGTARKGAWERAEPRFQLLDAGGYAAPIFADVDGDGAVDLLLAGDDERIGLYMGRPKDDRFPLWLASRNVLTILRLGGYQSRVRVATGDLDGDGDREMVLGSRSGQLLVYENVSVKGTEKSTGKNTVESPSFRSPQGPLLPTPQRAFSAPALVDLNSDGDLDLIVGGRDGRLEWIENTGTPKRAAWRLRSLFFAQVDVGSLSVPQFADMDEDGDADLLVGNSLGQVVYYENIGDAKRPSFQVRTVRFAGLRVAANASPALFGWNMDASPDLVVGDQTGELLPAVRDPALAMDARQAYRVQAPWHGLGSKAFSAPHFGDLSGDLRPDLLLGTGSGSLLVWRYEGSGGLPSTSRDSQPPRSNIVEGDLLIATVDAARSDNGLDLSIGPQTASDLIGRSGDSKTPGLGGQTLQRSGLPLEPILVYEDSPLEDLRAGKSTHPAFFDHNGDGRPDLVVGNRQGSLLLFENTGNGWRPIPGSFAHYEQGRNAAPHFIDLDGDGDADLAVGNEQGRLTYFENITGKGSDGFTLREAYFKSVRGGRNIVPAFYDLDNDGRLDLLIGNLKGELQYYRHTGKKDDPFKLEMRRFIGMDVGISASPTFADLTREQRPFLIIGSDSGALRVLRPTGTSLERSSGWKENRTFFEGLKIPPGSHPALADIDGDGDMDMVVGSDSGKLSLYRNQAIQPELEGGLSSTR